MPWPKSTDYTEAVQNLGDSIADDELRHGEAARTSLGLPMLWAGNFADVYKICCPTTGNSWALKCFTRQVRGLQYRYRAIAEHLKRVRLPFTVDFEYLERGICVGGDWFPALKMRWVEGVGINRFVEDHLDHPEMLDQLLALWPRLAARLRAAGIAHADLQHGNVLLVPTPTGKLALRLIDYDGMFVPSLADVPSGELGHPAYQHPQRLREGLYNAEVDRFSNLAIYCAVRCLRVGRRELWRRFNNGDNLLFREADFRSPGDSELFRTLCQLPDAAAQALAGLLAHACETPLADGPLLEQVVGPGAVVHLTSQQRTAIKSLVAQPIPAGQGGAAVAVQLHESGVDSSGQRTRRTLAISDVGTVPAGDGAPPDRPADDEPSAAKSSAPNAVIRMLRAADGLLLAAVGEDNAILHNFLRAATAIAFLLAIGLAAVLISAKVNGSGPAQPASGSPALAKATPNKERPKPVPPKPPPIDKKPANRLGGEGSALAGKRIAEHKPVLVRRRAPMFYPAEGLHAAAGRGAFQLAAPAAAPPGPQAQGVVIPSIAGRRWVVLTALVPNERQIHAYAEAFANAVAYDLTRDVPKYLGYRVQRVEVADSSSVDVIDWDEAPGPVVFPDECRKATARWAGKRRTFDIVSPAYVTESLVFPLGPLVGATWSESAAHPPEIPMLRSTALGPGVGGSNGGLAGPGRSGNTATGVARSPDLLLLRYFDFGVEPGKRYVYRVMLQLVNPNCISPDDADEAAPAGARRGNKLRPEHLGDPSLAGQKWLETKWSAPSPVIAVPHDDRVLITSAPSSTVTLSWRSEPSAGILVAKWIQGIGIDASKEFTVIRGQITNFRDQFFVPNAGWTLPGTGSLPPSGPGVPPPAMGPGMPPAAPGMPGPGMPGTAPQMPGATSVRRRIAQVPPIRVSYLSHAVVVDFRGGEVVTRRKNRRGEWLLLVAPREVLLVDREGTLIVADELADREECERLRNMQPHQGDNSGALHPGVAKRHRGRRGRSPELGQQPQVPDTPPAGVPAGNGLHAELFADEALHQKIGNTVDREVDWLWGRQKPEPRLPSDAFSISWAGWLRPPVPGRYQFVAINDDGARVWIDGTPLIDDWNNHWPARNAAFRDLAPTAHSIRIHYKNHDGPAIMSLRWIMPGSSVECVVPAACFFTDRASAERAQLDISLPAPDAGEQNPNDGHGLLMELFSGEGASRQRTEVKVTYRLDRLTGENGHRSLLRSWRGFITASPGTYKLIAVHGGGARVLLNGKSVIEERQSPPLTRSLAEVQLTGGKNNIRIEHYENGEPDLFSLRWIPPGETVERVVPPEAFSH